MVAVFLGKVGEVLVSPFFHCKKGPMKLKLLVTAYHTVDSRVKSTVEFNRMTLKVGNGWSNAEVGHKSLQALTKASDERIVTCSRPGVMRDMQHRLSVTKSRDLGHQTVHVSVLRVCSKDVIGAISLSWRISWVLSHMGQETLKLGIENAGQVIHFWKTLLDTQMSGVREMGARTWLTKIGERKKKVGKR